MKSTNKLWRNDITGLRALAVIPVLLYHAFPDYFLGGYFGVDVFFVISGYLISGIIFRQIKLGNFSFLSFYEKRIRRIFPNLVLLLVFTLVLGWKCLLSEEFKNLGEDVFWSSFFVQNINLLFQAGYFDESSMRKPLLHLWSLAVEEQFYIIFPILIVLIFKFSARPWFLTALSILLLLCFSLVLCFIINPKFTFYFPLTRFWELGAGILIAWVENARIFLFREINLALRSFFSSLAVITLVIFLTFKPDLASVLPFHPGWGTVCVVLSATMVIMAGGDALPNRTVLNWKPITFIGLISYSLYLWHWPLLSYLYISVPNVSYVYKLCVLLISFVISAVIYVCIEQPARRTDYKLLRIAPVTWYSLGLVLVATLGFVISIAGGLPAREFNVKYSSMNNIREWVDFRGEKVVPGLDVPIFVSKTAEIPEVLLIGDSHAEQYWPRFKFLGSKYGVNVGILATPGCFFLDVDSEEDQYCKKTSQAFYSVLSSDKVKKVVFSSMWYYRATLGDRFERGVNQLREKAREHNLDVYIILDYPWDDSVNTLYDPLAHFNRFSTNTFSVDMTVDLPVDERWREGNEQIVKLAKGWAKFVEPTPYVCPGERCDLTMYRDNNHLRPKEVERRGYWVDIIFN